MSSTRYELAKSIFLAACDLDAVAREAMVSQRCDVDVELEAEVRQLLAHYAAATLASTIYLPIGDADAPGIEDYVVRRELDRGGMGVVYLAHDPVVDRDVAIKVVKRGMDTDEVLRRFRQERKLLGGLTHPGIAQLYGAGRTQQGLPYFVMEYVPGRDMIAHCISSELRVVDRLRLFTQVCESVQYANQNFIVHRDLKPGNILIGRDGLPKLLDFGIAKLLDEDRARQTSAATTPGGELPLTPEYASPEQVSGREAGVPSDIYSLGVMLYELLCGYLPYTFEDRRSLDEIRRVVCGTVPTPPSRRVGEAGSDFSSQVVQVEGGARNLYRKLSGDLDRIVMMALRKPSERRYASVADLGADVQRYLDGMPVHARGETRWYRTRSFARRNRRILTAAAVVSGAAMTAWYGVDADRREASVALEQLEALRQDRRRLPTIELDITREAVGEGLPGADWPITMGHAAMRRTTDAVNKRLDSLFELVDVNPMVRDRVADGYRNLGDALCALPKRTGADVSEAIKAYRKAAEFYGAGPSFQARDVAALGDMACVQVRLGDVCAAARDTLSATIAYTQARDLLVTMLTDQADGSAVALQLGHVHTRLGELALVREDATAMDALVEFRDAVGRFKACASETDDPRVRHAVGLGLLDLADAEYTLRGPVTAIDPLREAEKRFEELGRRYDDDRWRAVYRLARAFTDCERLDEALSCAYKALAGQLDRAETLGSAAAGSSAAQSLLLVGKLLALRDERDSAVEFVQTAQMLLGVFGIDAGQSKPTLRPVPERRRALDPEELDADEDVMAGAEYEDAAIGESLGFEGLSRPVDVLGRIALLQHISGEMAQAKQTLLRGEALERPDLPAGTTSGELQRAQAVIVEGARVGVGVAGVSWGPASARTAVRDPVDGAAVALGWSILARRLSREATAVPDDTDAHLAADRAVHRAGQTPDATAETLAILAEAQLDLGRTADAERTRRRLAAAELETHESGDSEDTAEAAPRALD